MGVTMGVMEVETVVAGEGVIGEVTEVLGNLQAPHHREILVVTSCSTATTSTTSQRVALGQNQTLLTATS